MTNRTYAWDGMQKLRSLVATGARPESYTAQYDGGGLRVRATRNGVLSTYSFGLLEEVAGVGNTVYTPGVSQRKGGVDRFFHSDWIGSTRYLTDATGNAAPTAYRFDSYGNLSATAGPDVTTAKFAGGPGYESDGPAGLQLLGHRYYDPALGRFLNPDPIGFAGGLNLYAYCSNDPANRIDPSGLYDGGPKPEHLAIIGAGARAAPSMVAAAPAAPNLAPPHIIPILISTGAVVETVRFTQTGQAAGPWTWVGVQVGSWLYPRDSGEVPASTAHMYQWVYARLKNRPAGGVSTKPAPCDKHHTVPREILKLLPPTVAKAVRGKRGAPNMWKIPRPLHKRIHEGPGGGRYNERWKEELRKLEEDEIPITADLVLRIRDKLAKEFGIDKYRP